MNKADVVQKVQKKESLYAVTCYFEYTIKNNLSLGWRLLRPKCTVSKYVENIIHEKKLLRLFMKSN